MANKKVLNELPADLLEEILLKLPVKSLVRFSLVSKTWESTISESGFVKRYRGTDREENIVISSGTSGSSHYPARLTKFVPSYNVSSLSRIDSGVEASSTELVFEFKETTHLMASCNELWLLSSLDLTSFYIWNPSTSRHKKITSPLMGRYRNLWVLGHAYYGIGYDSIGDDYKILKIPRGSASGRASRAQLYSLRSDSWRYLPNFPGDVLLFNSVFVSGKIHLLPLMLDDPRGITITCFDLSTDKFGEVVGPPLNLNISKSEEKTRIPLGTIRRVSFYASVFRGMLSLSVTDIVDQKCDIWVMEEYGVASSWTIKFTITNSGYLYKIKALCILESGALLVHGHCSRVMKDKVVVVDQDGQRQLACGSGGSCRMSTSSDSKYDLMDFGIVYADSLVAPDAFNSSKKGNLPSHSKKHNFDGIEPRRRSKRARTNHTTLNEGWLGLRARSLGSGSSGCNKK